MKRTLISILIIAIVLLAVAFSLQKITHINEQKEHLRIMKLLLPGADDFVNVPYTDDDPLIRSVHQATEGYVIETSTYGYADYVTMLIGVTNDGNVTGLVTYDAHETLGLGSKILTDHVFLSQFLNQNSTFAINTSDSDAFSSATESVTSSGEEIWVDAISGATVSSKAVARCVSSAVAYVTGIDAMSSATTWGE